MWFRKSKLAHMCCSLRMFLGMWQRVLLASREGSLKCDKRIHCVVSKFGKLCIASESNFRCDVSQGSKPLRGVICHDKNKFLCDVSQPRNFYNVVMYYIDKKSLKAAIYHKRINLLTLWNVKFSKNFLSFPYHKEANFHAMRCITSN